MQCAKSRQSLSYQVRLITYDIILMQLGIGQEIFPITHYQLPAFTDMISLQTDMISDEST